MISLLSPLPVGNAVRVTLDGIPDTAEHWRLLRNVTGAFPAFNDAASVVVVDANAGDPLQVVDFGAGLVNGTLTYYQIFYFDGAAWSVDTNPPASCIPATTYQDDSTDPQAIVRDRLTLGLAAEIARGALTPAPDCSDTIEVLTAPPIYDHTRWPVVSVHMTSSAPVNRAIGELVADDDQDTVSELWDDHEGWHSKVQLTIVGWSLNPDERIALRKAIMRIILANLPVFDAALLLQIEFSQQDLDAISGEYPAPVYETVGTFSCVAPIAINAPGAPITDVNVTVTPLN